MLSSDKLLFPNGQTVVRTAGVPRCPHHSNVSYVQVQARASGAFRMDVTFHAPGGPLRLATGELSVRSTSSSVVGVVLTVGAVAGTGRVVVPHLVAPAGGPPVRRGGRRPTRWRARRRALAGGRRHGRRPAGGAVTDEDASIEEGTADRGGDADPPLPGATTRLGGATAGMAVGTTLSRLTGVGRVVALTAALSGGGFADAYNLANTTPNIITDIVIGGVLAATFVPVFVAELTTRAAKEAWEAISAVVTVTVAVVVAASVVFFVFTPQIIDLYTITNHHADVHQQQQVAVFLLRWFVPQLACYGLIGLFTALLNTQGKFAAPMFVPIANNLVVIGMLVWFHELVPTPTWPPSRHTTPHWYCSAWAPPWASSSRPFC